MTVYANKGNRVEMQGTLIVRAADGTVIDSYPVDQIQKAVEQADELAESDTVSLIAVTHSKGKVNVYADDVC
jgi:hypothetical protein